MFLKIDFEQGLSMSVLAEMASRSTVTPRKEEDLIDAKPITHHHFGGVCYFSRHHGRYAWVRAYRENGEVLEDRIVVCFGYREVPADWQSGNNQMKHSHVASVEAAANTVVEFLLDDILPSKLFNGDYHYLEHPMKG